jgi:hypothetical protein
MTSSRDRRFGAGAFVFLWSGHGVTGFALFSAPHSQSGHGVTGPQEDHKRPLTRIERAYTICSVGANPRNGSGPFVSSRELETGAKTPKSPEK